MRRGCWVGCVTVAGIAALALVLAIGLVWQHHHRASRFNSSVWKTAPLTMDSPRYEMAKDLQKRYLHKGMTRLQVELLIGKPDKSFNAGAHPNASSYFLAPDGGGDAWILDVQYDKRDRLVKTEIRQN